MEAIIKIRPHELQQDLLDKLKSLVQGNDAAEIIIQVRENVGEFVEEDTADYKRQLKKSFAEIEAGQTTVFTMDELRRYVNDNFSP